MVKVYIETYGCTMNQADSDVMRAAIARRYELARTIDDADVVVINSCGVIDFTERKIIRRALELKAKGKKVVMAGCLPRISTKKVLEVSDALISPDNVLDVVPAIEAVLRGRRFVSIGKTGI